MSFFSRNTYVNTFYNYIAIFFFFTSLFIGGKLVVWSLALIFAQLIYELYRNKIHFKNSTSNILLIAFYLWHIVSITYSLNKDVAIFDLEVKLSLFIFPLIWLFVKDTVFFYKTLINNLYISSSFLVSSYLMILSLHAYFTTDSLPRYTDFSILLHPSYYALYLGLSIIITIYSLIKAKNKLLITAYLFAIILFLINIYLSESKSGYIATLLILVYTALYLGFKKSKLVTIISVLLIFIGLLFIFNNNPRFQTAFNVLNKYEEVLDNPRSKNSSTSMRILAWNASSKIISNNIILGVGAGDIKSELNNKYKELNYEYLIKYNLNAHNQFLETWLGQGLIGLILLLLVFIIPFIKAIKNKDFILQGFLIIVFINFLVESMLNTQAGVIFFAFFYSFLVSDIGNKRISKSKKNN